MSDLQNNVDSIAAMLTNGFDEESNHDGEEFTVYDYLSDVLDIQYIVTGKSEFIGARVLVAFGGPNIWIDTTRNIVEGYWWSDKATAGFSDNVGLVEALEELWNCR